MCMNHFHEFLMDQDFAENALDKSNSKILHFLTRIVSSEFDQNSSPLYVEKNERNNRRMSLKELDMPSDATPSRKITDALQFELSLRNKIIINFVNLPDSNFGDDYSDDEEANFVNEDEEDAHLRADIIGGEGDEIANSKRRSQPKKKKPKSSTFFGRIFSSNKKSKKSSKRNRSKSAKKKKSSKGKKGPIARFENVRVLGSKSAREKTFMDFHKIVYDVLILKLIRSFEKLESQMIKHQIAEISSCLGNSCSQSQLDKNILESYQRGLDFQQEVDILENLSIHKSIQKKMNPESILFI